jgi:hypothetical protein
MHSTQSIHARTSAFALTTCGVLVAASGAAQAGTAYYVGPSRTHTQITSALGPATTGDVILVDPGTYLPFDVNGEGVAIVGNGGSYTISAVANTPEIRVRNLAPDVNVTILDAEIAYNDQGAPAIRIENNDGAVRLGSVLITPNGHVFATSAQAVIEVDNTETFWLVDSYFYWEGINPVTGNPIEFFAVTNNPLAAGNPLEVNDGVSALQLKNSHGVIQNSRLRGYEGGTHGGDGLRLIDDGEDLTDASAWLLEDRVNPDFLTHFQGGPGESGGHAVHQIRTPFLADLIKACGGRDNFVSLSYVPGAKVISSGEVGGIYGRNNTNGSIGGGGGVAFAFPDHCPDAQRNESTVALIKVPIGGTFTTRVRTRIDRQYQLAYCSSAEYQYSVPGFSGRGVADSTMLLGPLVSGNTTGGVTTAIPFTIPNSPALIGTQVSVQAAFGLIGGGLTNIGIPGYAVIIP